MYYASLLHFPTYLLFILFLITPLCAQAQTDSFIDEDDNLPSITGSSNTESLTNTDLIKSPMKPHYFYSSQNYGSESQFGFWNVLLNVGLVVPGRLSTQPQLDEFNYSQGWKNVRSSLVHQNDVLRESGGTHASLKKEFIPFAHASGAWLPNYFLHFLGAHASGAWLPNYFLHFLGEGMLSRKLEEYYSQQVNASPIEAKIKAILTVLAAQTTNEIVEYELPWEQRLDPLADFYFNIAGIIAFSFDEVAQLLSNDYLDYYYWPGQPILDIQDGALFNQGEQYYFRSKFGLESSASLAVISGMPATGLGFSYPINDTDQLSIMFATDVAVSKPNEEVDKLERDPHFTASEIADLYNRSVNLYWDRKGSLMGSLAISYDPFYQLSLNVYPQHYSNFNIGGFSLANIGIGGYLLASEGGANSLGVTFSFTPAMLGVRR